jgi:hypothetical protein
MFQLLPVRVQDMSMDLGEPSTFQTVSKYLGPLLAHFVEKEAFRAEVRKSHAPCAKLENIPPFPVQQLGMIAGSAWLPRPLQRSVQPLTCRA